MKRGVRSYRGANLLEFSAIFSVLVLFVLVPLVDLAAVPARMAFANAAVRDAVHNLALSSKFSQAQSTLAAGSLLQARINSISGASLVSNTLSIMATNSKGSSSFSSPGAIPSNWLPDGEGGPYRYNLVLSCVVDISPLFLVGSDSGVDVPGLTRPFRANITESYAWENLSKNPETQQFYLNE